MDNEEDSADGSETEENSCTIMYYQAPVHNFETHCLLTLIETLMDDKMFDQVRNKDQFGYYVACQARDTRGAAGFTFVI